MIRGDLTLRIPNPHQSDIGVELLSQVLKQAQISRKRMELYTLLQSCSSKLRNALEKIYWRTQEQVETQRKSEVGSRNLRLQRLAAVMTNFA